MEKAKTIGKVLFALSFVAISFFALSSLTCSGDDPDQGVPDATADAGTDVPASMVLITFAVTADDEISDPLSAQVTAELPNGELVYGPYSLDDGISVDTHAPYALRIVHPEAEEVFFGPRRYDSDKEYDIHLAQLIVGDPCEQLQEIEEKEWRCDGVSHSTFEFTVVEEDGQCILLDDLGYERGPEAYTYSEEEGLSIGFGPDWTDCQEI